jgi:hypothetical protein
MNTPHSEENHKWTNMVHQKAQEAIYPTIFNNLCRGMVERISWQEIDFRTPEGEYLDGELKIDRIALVKLQGIGFPFHFTIQERFRSVEQNNEYFDITVAERCANSDSPSEVYNMAAELFLYGYYNESKGTFERAVLTNASYLKIHILHDMLADKKFEPKKHRGQNKYFVTVPMEYLIKNNLTLWYSEDLNNKYREEN